MHTVWVRLNGVVFFGLTVLLGLSCLAALSKIGHASTHVPGELWVVRAIWQEHFVSLVLTPTAYYLLVIEKLDLKSLRSLKSHGGVDRALLSFDLKADLRPAFHWNIKQLFVYVVASYDSKKNSNNQIVIWDKIVEAIHPEDMVIDLENVFVKYALVDQGDELRGKEVKLQLMWDHMPITGLLYQGHQPLAESSSFTLPAEYQ